MRKSKSLTIIFVLLLIMTCSFLPEMKAQGNPCLDETLKVEIVKKVNSFTNYLESFVNKSLPNSDRQAYASYIEKLFKPGAIIEVSSKRYGKQSFTIPEYLKRVYREYDNKYAVTVIKFERVVLPEVAHFKPIACGSSTCYVATANVVQLFCGSNTLENSNLSGTARRTFKPGDCYYSDQTEKTIEIVLQSQSDFMGEYCLVLLGDIKVADTQ